MFPSGTLSSYVDSPPPNERCYQKFCCCVRLKGHVSNWYSLLCKFFSPGNLVSSTTYNWLVKLVTIGINVTKSHVHLLDTKMT